MTQILELNIPNNDYSHIKPDDTLKGLVITIREKLNKFLSLRIDAKKLGESLFNLSALRQLDEIKSEIGSLLLGNLKGLTFKEIIANASSKFKENEYSEALNDLIEMGYVIKDKKDTVEIYRLRD